MTWKISFNGQVQGVGFRPLVWRAALDRQLTGQVANGLEGVRILLNATHQQALDFQEYIIQNAPETARITHAYVEAAPDTVFDRFTICDSHHDGAPVLYLTPDVALCADCRSALHDPQNRRFRYPFITCTVCGPRFSILTGLPYDRPLTTMAGFHMCSQCQSEYNDPAELRYFAQTNSCPDCGIQLRFLNGPVGDQETLLREVITAWQRGAIVAIKGTGGFLLTCDAANASTIATLRARKHRPTKPFALMYPDLATLKKDARVSDTAARWLQSPAAPIVLLQLQPAQENNIDTHGIAPGLHQIGAMLPNAPLFDLLLKDFDKPIVATSGNLSHAPLVFEDEVALSGLSQLADLILTHNRPVTMPQDDSVVRIQPDGTPVILRRARGLAPAFIQPGLEVPPVTALALGAEMKNTFALAHHGLLHISQYIGDLADFDVQERFRLVQEQLTTLLQARPAVVIGDLHPGYFTTQLGEILAGQWQAKWIQVQHHKAHFAAVLAENQLLHSPEPVLGVIWDGTGYGDDGQVWGGEFFRYQPEDEEPFERMTHFSYFPVILGDKMPREPRISALCACFQTANAARFLQDQFSNTEWALYPKLTAASTIKTSSTGRIFDAVAALLGLAGKVSYEGEAALLLEDMATSYCQTNGFDFQENYCSQMVQPGSLEISTPALFGQILEDLENDQPRAYIAAKFHWSLIGVIRHIARECQIQKIALSGGVFQNALLSEMATLQLTPDFQLYVHRQLSHNDENIAFGQWAYSVATG